VAVRVLAVPVQSGTVSAYSIAANDDAGVAAELMGKYNVDSLSVKEGDKLVGEVTARALLSYYSRTREKEHRYNSPARTKRMLAQGRRILRNSKIMGI
jgi:CBS domain-containing protein